jgi:hypothetical protein
MLSTAIPARLEFHCGHAALVSLPRIKGESPAQRNLRIALEKSAALARACDFCGPRLVNPLQVAPPAAVVSAPVEKPLSVVVPAAVMAALPPVEEAAAVVVPAPVVSTAPPVEHVEKLEEAVPVAAPAPVEAPVPVIIVPTRLDKRVPVAAKRIRRKRTARLATNGAAAHRFTVSFRAEQVLVATDIRDALRQVESLGVAELVAITRLN